MRVHFGRGAPKMGGGEGKDPDEEIGILGMPGDRRAHPETELIRGGGWIVVARISAEGSHDRCESISEHAESSEGMIREAYRLIISPATGESLLASVLSMLGLVGSFGKLRFTMKPQAIDACACVSREYFRRRKVARANDSGVAGRKGWKIDRRFESEGEGFEGEEVQAPAIARDEASWNSMKLHIPFWRGQCQWFEYQRSLALFRHWLLRLETPRDRKGQGWNKAIVWFRFQTIALPRERGESFPPPSTSSIHPPPIRRGKKNASPMNSIRGIAEIEYSHSDSRGDERSSLTPSGFRQCFPIF